MKIKVKKRKKRRDRESKIYSFSSRAREIKRQGKRDRQAVMWSKTIKIHSERENVRQTEREREREGDRQSRALEEMILSEKMTKTFS